MTALLVFAVLAQNPPKDMAAWDDLYQFECNAPWVVFDPPEKKSYGGYAYELSGAQLKARRETPATGKTAGVKLGLLSGIKDAEPETLATLKRFMDAFDAADVEAVIVGGDTGEEPETLDAIYTWLVEATKRPILSIAGNTERLGAHNYAIAKQRKAGNLQLINMGLVRRYDGPGFDVVAVSGYHDKKYLHLNGGCLYTDASLTDAESAIHASDDPVVLLVHGPPRQSGKAALDYVPGANNVGDPRLTDLIKREKVPFGVFGHILEAGGHATDLSGKPLPPKKLQPALYVDQGSANPLIWKMNDGTTTYGLAAILTVDGKQASYEVLKSPKPPRAQ